jgi:hypothetical protein
MNRRQFIYSVAVGSGVVVVGVPSVGLVAHPAARAAALQLDPALGAGLDLAGGFRVVSAYQRLHGALPFVLEGEGARFQIDVLRQADGAHGVFTTQNLELFVHGAGGPTQERGARALGLALERRIRAGSELPQLASFEERSVDASGEAFHVDFARTA